MGRIINYVVSSLVIVTMTLPMCALRVTVNGKSTGLPRFTPTIHQPIKLPVWPVWSGVIAQCFDWLKAPQISESIISSIGGRVVPITLHNYDVSPFLLLAHHSHSFTPLDPVRLVSSLNLLQHRLAVLLSALTYGQSSTLLKRSNLTKNESQ